MLWNLLVKFVNFLISSLGQLLGILFSILPNSPFRHISNMEVSDYIKGLMWIVPIGQMLSIFQLWLVAIAIYYVTMVLLRWVKALD